MTTDVSILATESHGQESTQTPPALAVRDLSKHYAQHQAVRGISFEVQQGEIFGLLGPNGAGKTTTMRMLVGLIRPTGGEVRLLGERFTSSRRGALRRVGAIIESPSFYPYLSGRDNLRMLADLTGACPPSRIDAVLELFASFYPRSRTPDELIELMDLGEKRKTRTQDLSGGQRQRLSVALEIRQGEVVGLLGPNGAGKTTTFYMVVGLARPDAGEVRLGDEDITTMPMYQRARAGIGYLPQEASVFRKLTTEENVRAILETRGLAAAEQRQRARELLEELGIQGMAQQPAYTLSGGERRRLEICRALAAEPSFILLDEPFAGIDPIAVIDIQKIIAHLRERGIGVLITDHNVRETLKITDRAYILRDGNVFRSGTPYELATDPEVRRVYLGEDFRLDGREA